MTKDQKIEYLKNRINKLQRIHVRKIFEAMGIERERCAKIAEDMECYNTAKDIREGK